MKEIENKIRSYNVGASDYSCHRFQPWDFWLQFALNPFDADIIKRLLRIKSTDSRELDYKKIKHICLERIRQLEAAADTWSNPKPNDYKEMLSDYYLLTENDKKIINYILVPSSERIEDYKSVIKIVDSILEVSKQLEFDFGEKEND